MKRVTAEILPIVLCLRWAQICYKIESYVVNLLSRETRYYCLSMKKKKILSVPLCDFLPTVKLVDFEERGLD